MGTCQPVGTGRNGKQDPRGDHKIRKGTPGTAPGSAPWIYKGDKETKVSEYDVVVVGCGLSGAIIARRLAEEMKKKVLIIEKRNHIGGNCYDYIDDETGILMNMYGAHLFHTNSERVFKYITKYGDWTRWEHQVVGLIDQQICPIPPNITTVNMLCGAQIKTVKEMDEWLSKTQVKYEDIKNGEQMAKSRVGPVLYEKIFKHYTYKQWKKYPEQLDKSILARIPCRNNFDTRYFGDKFQVLPKDGYTQFFVGLLDHPSIDVHLNTDFFKLKEEIPEGKLIIYTGPVDRYFASQGFETLEYRSINFHIERYMNYGFYQPNSVVNYPGKEVDFTRIVEYKHFLNQQTPHTVIVKETTTDKGDPYYPVLNDRNMNLFKKYKELADKEKNVHFVGRLANYKYFNMDQAILNALEYFDEHFLGKQEQKEAYDFVSDSV
uniref:UDP-galactopyranose mutase C-terminal domain-containing protein n=1 Tax=Lotharella oceanica TaxID=641309 RepID=A0A7S2TQE0_9EUKA|mmetsp:Transcript_25215/g.47059  ORF Transcript_25215/g.47059 Transcript_25215/m.47059 type:complete len:433 (+) Transcript_25215:47-1345(+)